MSWLRPVPPWPSLQTEAVTNWFNYWSICQSFSWLKWDFVIIMYDLIKQCNSGWKRTSFAAKLVSNGSCFYGDIFVATGMKVLWKNEKSFMLSVLSVLIGRSTLRFLVTGDVGMSWLAVHALRSDSPLPATERLQTTPSVGSSSSWDRPVYSAATFPATVWSQFRLDFRERQQRKCDRKGYSRFTSQRVSH